MILSLSSPTIPCRLAAAVTAVVAFLPILTTAEVVEYEWNIRPRISLPPLSPDCYVDRHMLLVEDQNPGPEIRANVGDTVRITWINHAPSEGVSIHYHGLLMQNQPYADGTGGISACVIGPMQTFVHEFTVSNPGTHYWHGHTSMDRVDGLQGAIIVQDPNDPDDQALMKLYDEDRVIFLQDWFHKSGPELRTGLDSVPGIWVGTPQSFLINGKGRFDDCVQDPTLPGCDEEGCTVEKYVASIPVESGKTYLFRFISGASLLAINVAIAGHNMTIVQVEGTVVEPLTVSSLDIMVAQRYSVLVTANAPGNSSYVMSTDPGRGPMGYAYLQYDGAPPPAENSTFWELPEHDSAGPQLDQSLFTKDISSSRYLGYGDILQVDKPNRSMIVVGVSSTLLSTGANKWAMNNVSNSLNIPNPLITTAYDAVMSSGDAVWPDIDIPGTLVVPDTPPTPYNYSVTLGEAGVGEFHDLHGISIVKFVKGDVVDLVLQNAMGSRGWGYHGWHLHGHRVYVIGQGSGSFDPDVDPASFNLVNPLLRDTVSVYDGWTAIRLRADNVGAWPFHCTLVPHAVEGMGFNVITSPDMLPPPPPGLVSCVKTSVNPADAEVCVLMSQWNGPGDVTSTRNNGTLPYSMNLNGNSSTSTGDGDSDGAASNVFSTDKGSGGAEGVANTITEAPGTVKTDKATSFGVRLSRTTGTVAALFAGVMMTF